MPFPSVVLVVPPFAGLDSPAVGPHILQAVARDAGFDVFVFYANVRYARVLGESLYRRISYGSSTSLAGERIFAHLAYGVPRLGYRNPSCESPFVRSVVDKHLTVSLEDFKNASAVATAWLPDAAAEILALGRDIVGCSSSFEQTAASVALLRRLKQARPEIVTLLGGANCEGEMGDGLASLVPEIDYTFAGECEEVFPEFLREIAAQRRSARRVVHGTPCRDMSALPLPDYSDYYQQLELIGDFQFVQANAIWLPYESSRGCWWGEKRHCTFCGVNGETISFRSKAPEKVVSELVSLLGTHPSRLVLMVDNIMPHDYFRTLLPALGRSGLGAHIFYEQKANLKLDQVKNLRDAGIGLIQPGIEALSSPLLRLMRKGVSAAQNIRSLRYCRSCDVAVNWNLLFAFPQDRLAWYEDTLRLLPLLRHLHPPSGPNHLALHRFSPYYENPDAFGISDLGPIDAYRDVLPRNADVARIACRFTGEYESESRHESHVMGAIRDEIAAWRLAWQADSAVMLVVTRLDDSTFLLADSRSGGDPTFEFLDEAQARLVLLGARDDTEPNLRWAAERGWIARVDDQWIALATADYELMEYFEAAKTILPRPQLTSPPGRDVSLPQTSSRRR
ncbi:MAG: RiPP maturation radical SAM C-methyltransferase [Thermoanaerobaculia bacterium]